MAPRRDWSFIVLSLGSLAFAGWSYWQLSRKYVESLEFSARLLATTNFAAGKHQAQRRKNSASDPYINHPIGVAHLLTSVGGIRDIVTLQSAVLHDTVEDTDTTLEEIERHFGVEVRNVVAEVTDDKALTKLQRKQLQVEKAPYKSRRAQLVSLADKTHNILSFFQDGPPAGWDQARVQHYAAWSWKVVRGYRGVNRPLEALFDSLLQRSLTLEGREFRLLPADPESAPLL